MSLAEYPSSLTLAFVPSIKRNRASESQSAFSVISRLRSFPLDDWVIPEPWDSASCEHGGEARKRTYSIHCSMEGRLSGLRTKGEFRSCSNSSRV